MNRWRVPSGPATHVLMDGGILFVPLEDTMEFYRTYIDLINLGTKLYVVEQKTENFKFFVDLDYKAKEKLKDDDLLQFCFIIQEAVQGGRCLISRAQPRPVKEGIKTGVHLHWPDLIVNRIQALNLRSKIITSLGEGPWDTIVDASVYGGSGLRMLWSHKKPTGDPYIPWKELGGPDLSKEPSVEMLALFAVRTEEQAKETETLADTSALEDFVQRYLPGQRRARIKKVQRHEHDGWFAQTDSRYCERIKSEHKSNHVWFSIHSGRIFQRCLDDQCTEFKSEGTILSPSIVEQLEDVAIVGSPSSSFLMDVFPNRRAG
jgi:hypothetical protein